MTITSPFPQIATPPQALAEVLVNEMGETLKHGAVYGKDQSTTSGLIWGYYGGRWGGFSITAATFTLTGSNTNYIVVARATGVSTCTTATTNWNDATNYARVYKLTTNASAVTAEEDHRAGGGGVHGQVSSTVGDASTNTSSSVDSEIALFSSTTGKVLKRATGSGLANVTSGVFSVIGGSNDDFAQRKSGAFTNRTVAQVTTDLQGTGLITDAVGFRTIPQNSRSAAYTTTADDSGKHILHPSADTTARVFTIDSNANVAYPLGTAITFINQNAGGVITISITSDTMRLAGAGTTGSRTLAANGIATAVKITTTEWIISGTGLT